MDLTPWWHPRCSGIGATGFHGIVFRHSRSKEGLVLEPALDGHRVLAVAVAERLAGDAVVDVLPHVTSHDAAARKRKEPTGSYLSGRLGTDLRGSPRRIRTFNLAVNSRLLYR